MGNRVKHTFRLPPALSRQLADFAGHKRVSQASVVEAAISSFLSPDGSERLEAAFSRRLDRMTRRLDKVDYHVEVGNEAIALFVHRWLAATPVPMGDVDASVSAAAERRYDNFVEMLAHRMEGRGHLSEELVRHSSAY